ncbi:Glutamyl-tRNA synthetase [Pseudoloma neurophilia]|uniref:Probable glutamate--tRNA ligase, cytoplasmic n=1 Tax=Pseudoloma neurophilia TaxID=146866 RepID=A0A0R0LZG7_9MICR|nr:Glutamyl-tRNA synthetase [Pseudoloma neurophilia]
MEVILDPRHFLTASLFYLIRKYTEHLVKFEENTSIDHEKIKMIFAGCPVEKHVNRLLQKMEAGHIEETEKLLEQCSEDISVLKDVYYSFLYTDKKFLNQIKKELKNKESHDSHLHQFENEYKTDTLAQEFKKMMKPKETCRFPPEPSGYLHLGHVKAAFLNNNLSDNLIVRFDDTNQEKSSDVFEKAILEDLKLLQLKEFKLSRSSDFHPKIVELCRKMIADGNAYCDDTDKEQMNIERMDGIESKRRNVDIKTNLAVFEKMVENGLKDFAQIDEKDNIEKYCVRAKIAVNSNNKALRDPVICRLKKIKHPRTNSRFSPTYDFSCPIVDSIEGVTTVLRTNEFRDRNEQYFWILDALQLRKPKIQDFSRLNFENTCLSKRKLRTLIEENNLTWDDPRIPTVKGILRLGLHITVLKEYIIMQGMKQSSHVTSWDKIWAMNKKYLDKVCNRYFAIKEDGKYHIKFVDESNNEIEPFEEKVSWPLNKKDLQAGQKEVLTRNIAISQEDGDLLETNEEFTLMIVGNCIVKEKNDNIITCISNPDGDIKKTKRKISWISLDECHRHELVQYSDLLKDDQFDPHSKKSETILVEKASQNIQPGEMVQFERIAFVRRDPPTDSYVVVPCTLQKREN